MKETFIIRTEWANAILELSIEEQAIVVQNLFYFHTDRENLINLKNLSVKLVWSFIEPNLKRNIAAYDRRIETSRENGKKGGRPKEPKKPRKPRQRLSDSVLVSEDVLVSEFENTFKDFLEMRIKIKKPATSKAISLIHKDLDKLSEGNVELKTAILNQSIKNSWQGVFPLKQEDKPIKQGNNKTKFSSAKDEAFFTANPDTP